METLQCKITHKVLHNSKAGDKHPPIELGKAIVRVNQGKIHGTITFQMLVGDVPAYIARAIRPAVREQAKSYLSNRKYQIHWNEDNCIETQWSEKL